MAVLSRYNKHTAIKQNEGTFLMDRFLCLGILVTTLGCSAASRPLAQSASPTETTKEQTESVSSIQALPSKTSLSPPILVQSDKPVIWIHNDYWAGELLHGLEVVVWANGRIVWFADGKRLMNYTSEDNVKQLLTKLHVEGVFGSGKGEYGYSVPDGALESIVVKLSDRKLTLRSCHELFEEKPNLVALSFGVTSLDGRKREEVLAKEPYEFQRFRRIWSEIRATVRSWTPKEGGVFVGEIFIEEGD